MVNRTTSDEPFSSLAVRWTTAPTGILPKCRWAGRSTICLLFLPLALTRLALLVLVARMVAPSLDRYSVFSEPAACACTYRMCMHDRFKHAHLKRAIANACLHGAADACAQSCLKGRDATHLQRCTRTHLGVSCRQGRQQYPRLPIHIAHRSLAGTAGCQLLATAAGKLCRCGCCDGLHRLLTLSDRAA
jgi:hypothetical protein